MSKLILGIESSCDDTGVAIIKDDSTLLAGNKNEVSYVLSSGNGTKKGKFAVKIAKIEGTDDREVIIIKSDSLEKAVFYCKVDKNNNITFQRHQQVKNQNIKLISPS